MRSNKKQEELFLFDEFRRQRPDLSFSHIQQPDPPAPDILCDCGGYRIGIEMTRYLRSSEKQRESEENCIVEQAQSRYEANGMPAVGASIHFVKREDHQRSDPLVFSQRLAEVMSENVPAPGGRVDLDGSSLPSPLDGSVHRLVVDRVIDYERNNWRLPRAAFIPHASLDQIRAIIRAKDARHPGYRAFCDSAWLVIASEGFGPSSWCELPPTISQLCFTTRFSRVFFLSAVPRQVVELSVQTPPG